MIDKPPWLYSITRRNDHSNLRRKNTMRAKKILAIQTLLLI